MVSDLNERKLIEKNNGFSDEEMILKKIRMVLIKEFLGKGERLLKSKARTN